MPRKLVKDSYRGWYGWEARFNSIIRMSVESMNNTNAKNKKERFRHEVLQEHLNDGQRKYAERIRKDLHHLKQELYEIRAYGKAYQKYSFYNTINARNSLDDVKDLTNEKTLARQERLLKKSSSENNLLDARTVSLHDEKSTSVLRGTNASGGEDGDADTTMPKRLLKVSFADVATASLQSEKAKEQSLAGDDVLKGAKLPNITITPPEQKEEHEAPIYRPTIHALPSINSIYNKKKDDATERTNKFKIAKRLKHIAMWNRAITTIRSQISESNTSASDGASDYQDKMSEKGSEMPEQAPTKNYMKEKDQRGAKTKQEIRAKIFPPECRNTFTLRKFINEQAEDILKVWTPETVRRHKVKKILEQVKFPELVNRNRSTSGIFREYHRYQKHKGSRFKSDDKKNKVVETVNDASFRALKERYQRHEEDHNEDTMNDIPELYPNHSKIMKKEATISVVP